VVDGVRGFGNGRLIPAGPLRESPILGFRRAHAVILLNPSNESPTMPTDRPVLTARTRPKDAAALKGRKIYAFCGLAYPDKFFEMLSALGVQMKGQQAFPDHHPYTELDIRKLILHAHINEAVLVTTAKDAVRIPTQFRDCVAKIDMQLEFDKEAMLDGILDYILKPHEKT